MFAAATIDLRELATIPLYMPLIWAFVTLRRRGMILAGVFMSLTRVAVEVIQFHRVHGQWALGGPLSEAVLPLLLFLVFGLVLYEYRRRQDMLLGKVVEISTVEARDRLASSLTHDINNVLTVIIGMAQTMLRDSSLNPHVRKDVETILSAGDQGAGLIRQMRSSTSAPAQHLELQDLAGLVDQQMVLIEKVLPASIHVVRHSSGQLPVMADRGQILRVLMNLCLNARDAMCEGGVLTVRTGRRDSGGQCRAFVAVSDTGPGIDASLQGKIFEPFFTTRRDQGNTGLGLSIIKSIAQVHGGQVEFENIPGSGAQFIFLLPIEPNAA